MSDNNQIFSHWHFVLVVHITDLSFCITIKSTLRLPYGNILGHLCDIYVARNAGLWNREDVHRWVLAAAKELLETLDGDNELMHKVRS
jgi:hypothetical protein